MPGALDNPSTFEQALSIVGQWEAQPEPKAPDATAAEKPAPAEQPSAEAQPEPEPEAKEAAPEQKEAPEKEAEATPAETQPRKHKLKYHGEDIEVEEEEMKSGYLRHRDYTQKTQEVAKERAELPEKVRAQVEPVLKQYQERLTVFEKALWQAIAPEVNNTDWNALARDDPAMWAQKMQAVTNVNNVLNAVRQEQQRLQSEEQARARETLQRQVKEANEILQRDIPGWNQELYSSLVRGGEKYGFSAEEMARIADPRAIKLLHDAVKYRQLQEAKPAVDKRVADVPKVVKPGTAEKADPNADKFGTAMKKLKQTGKQRDAVEAAKFFV